MATLALPAGASKALGTTKGKAYAGGGVAALVLVAYLLLSGGDATTKPASPSITTAKPAPATTAGSVVPAPAAPFTPSARNPFLKGDGSLPKTKG